MRPSDSPNALGTGQITPRILTLHGTNNSSPCGPRSWAAHYNQAADTIDEQLREAIVAIVSQDQLAQEVHAAGTRIVIAVTGGGSRAISALLGVPGASRSILAAVVPYAAEALIDWLGGRPDEFCSERTARAWRWRPI